MLHAATVALLVLHTADGRDVDINPAAITSLRETHDEADLNRPFTGKVRCMINTVDGKFVTVIETCDQIREMIK
jgi:hypothetical protein